VVLQNCKHEALSGSYSETYPTSSADGSQMINMEDEDLADIQLKEDTVLIEFRIIQNENEVSCIFVYLVVCEQSYLSMFHLLP
jgi:hypothetical protein